MAKRKAGAVGPPTAYRYLDHRGKARKQEELADYEVVVVGQEATGEPDLVRVFPDRKQFRSWAKGSPVAERVDQVYSTLERDVLPQRKNESWVRQMQTLALRRTRDSFRAFATLQNLKPNDEEVIRLAMIERTPLTPSIFDPMVFYDRQIESEPPQGAPVDPRTNLLPVPSGFWPDLGWVGWNDRPRSARVFGVNTLFENAWFGGRNAWLFGFNMLLNLYHLLFDQMTSSVISY